MGVEEAINLNTLTVPSARLFLISMAALSVLYLFFSRLDRVHLRRYHEYSEREVLR